MLAIIIIFILMLMTSCMEQNLDVAQPQITKEDVVHSTNTPTPPSKIDSISLEDSERDTMPMEAIASLLAMILIEANHFPERNAVQFIAENNKWKLLDFDEGVKAMLNSENNYLAKFGESVFIVADSGSNDIFGILCKDFNRDEFYMAFSKISELGKGYIQENFGQIEELHPIYQNRKVMGCLSITHIKDKSLGDSGTIGYITKERFDAKKNEKR